MFDPRICTFYSLTSYMCLLQAGRGGTQARHMRRLSCPSLSIQDISHAHSLNAGKCFCALWHLLLYSFSWCSFCRYYVSVDCHGQQRRGVWARDSWGSPLPDPIPPECLSNGFRCIILFFYHVMLHQQEKTEKRSHFWMVQWNKKKMKRSMAKNLIK